MNPNLIHINDIGAERRGTVHTKYTDLVEILGPPNVCHLDDPGKVEASWGLQDEATGRKIFVWCYKDNAFTCANWSVCGDNSLLSELFGTAYIPY